MPVRVTVGKSVTSGICHLSNMASDTLKDAGLSDNCLAASGSHDLSITLSVVHCESNCISALSRVNRCIITVVNADSAILALGVIFLCTVSAKVKIVCGSSQSPKVKHRRREGYHRRVESLCIY